MKKAILLHNPTAGSGAHSKKSLVTAIESAGYKTEYFSTDIPGWESFTKHKADAIFVAGGDGTVQKLASELLKAGEPLQKVPIQVLPMGTANNIAATLILNSPVEELVKYENSTGFDVGKVSGIGEAGFFIEALGFGVFPRLVQVMEEREEKEGELDPEEELKQSLHELSKIVETYEAREAIIIADGVEISGKFLLVEIMNIRFIGPHFELAPRAKTGDGNFELVAIPEDAREDLKQYVEDLINKDQRRLLEDFAILKKVKQLRLKWMGEDAHVDDEIIDGRGGEEIRVINEKAAFNFRTS